MKSSHWTWFLACTACACGTDRVDERSTPDASGAPTTLVPGTCVGAPCEVPSARPLVAGDPSPCEDAVGAANVVWQRSLEDLGCPLGLCTPVVASLTGADDSLWVTSRFAMPGNDVFEERSFGLGLARLASDGTFGFSSLEGFPTWLSGPDVSGGPLLVDEHGNLQWLAPARGAPGLDLVVTAPDGKRTQSRRLLDEAVSVVARGRADGSFIVMYQHTDLDEQFPDGGTGVATGPERATDIARFDANGRVLWNVPVSRVLGLSGVTLQGTITPELDATYVAAVVPADVEPKRGVLARLDADGVISWLKEVRNSELSYPMASADGGVFVSFSPSASSAASLVKLDGDGNVEWNRLSEYFPVGSLRLAGEEAGRVWVTQPLGPSGTASVYSISSDGTRCETWSLDAGNCVTGADGATYCADVFVAPIRDDAAYFGGASTVGFVTFGGKP